jgi:hypothetical protein
VSRPRNAAAVLASYAGVQPGVALKQMADVIAALEHGRAALLAQLQTSQTAADQAERLLAAARADRRFT